MFLIAFWLMKSCFIALRSASFCSHLKRSHSKKDTSSTLMYSLFRIGGCFLCIPPSSLCSPALQGHHLDFCLYLLQVLPTAHSNLYGCSLKLQGSCCSTLELGHLTLGAVGPVCTVLFTFFLPIFLVHFVGTFPGLWISTACVLYCTNKMRVILAHL